jgi:hypothetical protein
LVTATENWPAGTAFGVDHPAVGHTLHMLAKLYRQAGRSAEAEELSRRAMEILGPEHPAVVLADYESGKRARDHTFFGQFSEYRWTGLRMDAGDNPQRMTLLGEATFNNGLWNLFEVGFTRKDGVWKVTGFLRCAFTGRCNRSGSVQESLAYRREPDRENSGGSARLPAQSIRIPGGTSPEPRGSRS